MKGIQNTFSRLVQHEGKKLRGDDTSVGSNEFKVTSTRMLLTPEGCISLSEETCCFLPPFSFPAFLLESLPLSLLSLWLLDRRTRYRMYEHKTSPHTCWIRTKTRVRKVFIFVYSPGLTSNSWDERLLLLLMLLSLCELSTLLILSSSPTVCETLESRKGSSI